MATVRAFAADDASIAQGIAYDDSMGDEVRVTVIAAGFDRWDGDPKAAARGGRSAGNESPRDVFGSADDESEDSGDDDFDVPSFLK